VTETRVATTEDAGAIATIVRGLAGENVGLANQFTDAERVREWLKRVGEGGCVLLACEGSIPVAFAALDYNTMEPDTATIGVWVLPEYRRRGLATDLADELLAAARDKGYRRIRGRLPEGNEPALSFLSSIGAMVPLRNPNMTFELPL
jgi:ribosomal protein S18 acetylase RimI-like enzyme